MIRFILKYRAFDGIEYKNERFETLDVECPTLESKLRSGGYGGGPNNDAFEFTELIGVEVKSSQEEGKL